MSDEQARIKALEALATLGMTVITNSEPHQSLNASYRERYWIAMQEYLDTYHSLGMLYTDKKPAPAHGGDAGGE